MPAVLGALAALRWLKYVPTAVSLVEKILPGKGRGKEKKQVATEIIAELVKELPVQEQPTLEAIDAEIEAVVPHVKAEASTVLPTGGHLPPDNTIININIRVTLDQIVDLVKRGVFR